MKYNSVLFALGLPISFLVFGSACAPPEEIDGGVEIDAGTPPEDAGTPPDDAGTPLDDAGTPLDDAGTPPEDAGTPPEDAGTPPEDAGTPPEDAGTAPEDAGTPPADAGTPPADAGIVPTVDAGTDYVGEAELGVRCGDPLTTCAAGAACCASLTFPVGLAGECSAVPPAGEDATCPDFALSCDDREQDCAGDDVCCFALATDPPELFSQCMPAAECAAIGADPQQPESAETCLATADCPAPLLCCGVQIPGFAIEFDIGICTDTCE